MFVGDILKGNEGVIFDFGLLFAPGSGVDVGNRARGLLYCGKHFACALDDFVRESCKLCNFNAVAIVGGAAHDLTQERNAVSPLFCGNVVVDNAVELLFHNGELVIVGSKQSLGANLAAVGVFYNGTRNAHTVKGRGSATNFIVNN